MALVKDTNDILMKMNTQEVTLLVMLDLSATFDTVNHNILLKRLNKELMICEVALEWFKSYLANRSLRHGISLRALQFGLRCSTRVLSGPLAFCYLCIQAIHGCWDQLPHAHCYADDTQIYLSFKPNSCTSQEDAVRLMECRIEKIRSWLIQGRLLLMIDKTEFMIIGTQQQLCKLQAMNIKVGSSEIPHVAREFEI